MVPVVGRLLSLKRPVFRGYVSFREGIFRAFDVRLRKCRSNGSQRSKKMTHLPIGDAWWCFNTCKLDIAVIATRDQQFWVINTSSFNLFYGGIFIVSNRLSKFCSPVCRPRTLPMFDVESSSKITATTPLVKPPLPRKPPVQNASEQRPPLPQHGSGNPPSAKMLGCDDDTGYAKWLIFLPLGRQQKSPQRFQNL